MLFLLKLGNRTENKISGTLVIAFLCQEDENRKIRGRTTKQEKQNRTIRKNRTKLFWVTMVLEAEPSSDTLIEANEKERKRVKGEQQELCLWTPLSFW